MFKALVLLRYSSTPWILQENAFESQSLIIQSVTPIKIQTNFRSFKYQFKFYELNSYTYIEFKTHILSPGISSCPTISNLIRSDRT